MSGLVWSVLVPVLVRPCYRYHQKYLKKTPGKILESEGSAGHMGTDCADISQCSSGQHCDEFLAVPAVPPALPSLPSPSPLLPPPAGGLSVLLCSHCQGRSRLMSLVRSLTHTVLSLVGIIVLKNQPKAPKALLAFCWFFMV